MRIVRLMSAGIVLGLLFGCKPGHSVVGSWNTTPGGGVFNFQDGGKFTLSADAAGKGQVTADGTYSYEKDGEKLTFTAQNIDISKLNLSPTERAMAQGLLEAQLKKAQTGTVKWASDDQFTFTPTAAPKGQTTTQLTFDRKK